jgi:hypothetical protein
MTPANGMLFAASNAMIESRFFTDGPGSKRRQQVAWKLNYAA